MLCFNNGYNKLIVHFEEFESNRNDYDVFDILSFKFLTILITCENHLALKPRTALRQITCNWKAFNPTY